MSQSARCDAVHDVEEECDVIVAKGDLVKECLRLRYQVYCVEKGFEPGRNGLETDPFDDEARHVLLIHRASGEPIGTVRVIPPSATTCIDDFPMARACARGLLNHMPPRTTGEISRFAVSKQRRFSCGAGKMVRLGLLRGIVRVSVDAGLTHWCAVMEPILLRLLQRDGIYYAPLGPLVDYHGMRQPSYAHISRTLNQARCEQWDVWNYVTMGGLLCPEAARPAAAAWLELA